MKTLSLWEQYNQSLTTRRLDQLDASYERYIVCGMGGSHLAASLIAPLDERISIHTDYGLPTSNLRVLRRCLIILVSYSGNTEEVLDAYHEAHRHNLPMAVISTGGELLRIAHSNDTPTVQLPIARLQPRDALGFQLRGLSCLMRSPHLPDQLASPNTVRDSYTNEAVRHYTEHFSGRIGLIYGTATTAGLAYIWKITLNETGKMPAHYNLLPEINHNELESYGAHPTTKHYAGLLLTSTSDHPRNQKRASITQRILTQFFPTERTRLQNLDLSNLLTEVSIATKTATELARQRSLDPEQVPTIERFKKNMLE